MKVFLTFIFIRFNQILIIGVPHPVLSSESEISHYSSVPTSGQSPCGVVIRSYSAQPPLQHPTHHFHLSEWCCAFYPCSFYPCTFYPYTFYPCVFYHCAFYPCEFYPSAFYPCALYLCAFHHCALRY